MKCQMNLTIEMVSKYYGFTCGFLFTYFVYFVDITVAFRCLEGWRYHTDRCYFFSRQKSQWATASYICAELGGTLAHVETEDESNFLEDFCLNEAYVGCFNDGEDRLLTGDYHYSDQLTNRMCLEYCRERDYELSGTQFYGQCYCGNASSGDLVRHGAATEKDCYLPCFGNKQDTCGGHWKLSVYQTNGRKHWVGGTDQIIEGKWIWFPGGKTITFSDWSDSEPDNQLHSDFNHEHCMALAPNLNGTYKWHDENCNEYMHYICERTTLFY